MSETKRRDKNTIIIEILETAKKEVKPTHLLYRTNMSFNNLARYTKALIGCGYLEKEKGSGNYKTTTEGLIALEILKESSEVLEKFNEHWKIK